MGFLQRFLRNVLHDEQAPVTASSFRDVTKQKIEEHLEVACYGNFVLTEAYESPAGIDDHWKQAAESWEDFGAFMAWAGKVKVAVLHGSPVVHSLW